jgi:pimeloyl-ACP methyl ester carboxylesterase
MRRMKLKSSLLLTIIAATVTVAAQTSKPSQTRQLRANGTDLSYVEQGSGTPVVFVHGAVGDLRFWEPQREAFARRHRFIAYTYRYHGPAAWPDEGKQYSAATHAADLAAFIEGLKAGPVHLVGLSYGGLLAAIVATRQPQLVRSLTLAEPALFGVLSDLPEGKPALESWNQGAAPIVAAVQKGDVVSATKLLVAFVNAEPVENFDKLPAALRQLLLDNARTLPLLFAGPPEAVTREALGAVKIPTLLVRGERTPQIFAKTNEVVARAISGSREVVVSNAAHTMSYQNPAGFNQAVLAFVDRSR